MQLLAFILSVFLVGCAGSGVRPMPPPHGAVDASVEQRAQALHTVTFAGVLKGTWMRRSGAYQFAGAVRFPENLRFDLFDPALGVVASLVVADGELLWFLPQEMRAYRGPATAAAMQRTMRMAWSPADIARLLAGLPPAERHDAVVDFTDYRSIKGISMPHALHIATHHPKTTVALQYESIEPNVRLAPETFQMTLPEGTRIMPLK